MLPEFWNTTCAWCKVVFQQRRHGTPGARAKLCDRRICAVASNWRRKWKREPPPWLVAKWKPAYGDRRRPERISAEHRRSLTSEHVVAMKEQTEFLRIQNEAWRERVRKVAADNPDMSWELLAERFGVDGTCIRRACPDLPRERDWFATGRPRKSA